MKSHALPVALLITLMFGATASAQTPSWTPPPDSARCPSKWGASDERGANVTDRVVSMGDLYATIYQAMGIDWKREYMSPIGRPIKIADLVKI